MLSLRQHNFQSAPRRKWFLKTRYSISVNVRLLTRQKSAIYSSSLRPQAPLRSFPGKGSSVTLLIYFARVAQSRNWSKHARKMALSTQLQGCDASFRPMRSPKPRHTSHAGTASAKVSDLFHFICFLFLATRKQPSRLPSWRLGITAEPVEFR